MQLHCHRQNSRHFFSHGIPHFPSILQHVMDFHLNFMTVWQLFSANDLQHGAFTAIFFYIIIKLYHYIKDSIVLLSL